MVRPVSCASCFFCSSDGSLMTQQQREDLNRLPVCVTSSIKPSGHASPLHPDDNTVFIESKHSE
ncbi:hypothetical protein EYF80_062480 [Liparis tanakae]|uniref:Uncharacterized protein n=1 Tax=Liparis tanakae TaxID=230148 RepID=A0A4Z2EES4_9TELE|nr:hypothetical protein EYF80_062480 [Liparis tanakae]